MQIFKNLKKPAYILGGTAITLGVFLFQYHLMATLPGAIDFQCVVGSYLTKGNIAFAATLAILTGIAATGILALTHMRATSKKIALGSLSGLAVLIGTLTAFCTLCTLPVITFFGTSLGLSALTEFNPWFKALSLLLMGISIYLINMQLQNQCDICKIGK